MDCFEQTVLPRSRAGLTLVEAMLAIAILGVAVIGLTRATTAGHQHLDASDLRLTAARLAERLVDEVASRPYSGTGGPGRAGFHIDDFDGFTEDTGGLAHFSGESCPSSEQGFSRSVEVDAETIVFSQLGGAAIDGKRVTVTVEHSSGRWSCQLERFVPEPLAP